MSTSLEVRPHFCRQRRGKAKPTYIFILAIVNIIARLLTGSISGGFTLFAESLPGARHITILGDRNGVELRAV